MRCNQLRDILICSVIFGILLYLFMTIEPREKKCIDDKVHQLTSRGYWVAYNIVCKSATIEETRE